ncbi:MAG: amidohydrolase family protein [Lysobacterales bacterium]
MRPGAVVRPLPSGSVDSAVVQLPPPGSVDTHVHVLDPRRFPYDDTASYAPAPHETGTVQQLECLLDAQGIDGVVIVDPSSGYNGDSRCMLDALAHLGQRARGIARWVPGRGNLDRAALTALAERSVAGVRIDFVGDGLAVLDDPSFRELLGHLADLDLVLDVQCERDQMCSIAPVLDQVPVRVVVDHIGRPYPPLGIAQPGFAALLDLAQRGNVWVKLSGPMRMSTQPGWHDMDPFVDALVRHLGTDALVWGSDWPFLRAEARIDYAPLLGLAQRWLPHIEDRRRLFVANPRTLFGFAAVAA